MAAIFDRDYFPDTLIDNVISELTDESCLAHVHSRKELENYLLDSTAILSALRRQLGKSSTQTLPDINAITSLLEDACEEVKEQVFTQSFAKRLEGLPNKENLATRLQNDRAEFEAHWSSMQWRISHVPGREVLKHIKRKIQEEYKISVNNTAIASCIRKEEMPEDLLDLFEKLKSFLLVAR